MILQIVVLLSSITFVLSESESVYDCGNKPTGTNCTSSLLGCCDRSFRQALGIDSKCNSAAIYDDPDCMRYAIEALYSSASVDEIFKVCSEFYNFKTCLGRTFRTCTSARWLIINGKPYTKAELYATIFAQYNFACGAGLDTFVTYDTCMSGILGTNSTVLKRCRDEFYINIQNSPDAKCLFLDQLTACYEKPFLDNCGVEAGWWGCEYERIGASLFLPECSPKCVAYQGISGRGRQAVKKVK
ncbi:unnamed protein product [Enterobius vermicularis]|uniref:ShKT domain-containing protein n=1 Tax=Enterobius vermicularis TaxID=51028 RepID=A0A0N4UWF8_ENTVE|nr:unnamed protein product [Enterobius vermicularis]